jgi:hypothetical protein
MRYTIFKRKSLVLLVTTIALLTAAGFVAGLDAKAAGAGDGNSGQRVTRSYDATWTSGDTTIIGNCENGALLMVDSGTGYCEHLGKATWSSTYCTDPVTWLGSGIGVATAANGDEIRYRITLRFIWTSPSGGNWFETDTAMGGTGRFVGATGSGTSSGTFSMTSATTAVWDGTSTGTFTY